MKASATLTVDINDDRSLALANAIVNLNITALGSTSQTNVTSLAIQKFYGFNGGFFGPS